jgi:hypothetical protein
MKFARLAQLVVIAAAFALTVYVGSAVAQCTPDVPTGSTACSAGGGPSMIPATRGDEGAAVETAYRYPAALIISRWFTSNAFHAGLGKSALRERRLQAIYRRNPWGLRVKTH